MDKFDYIIQRIFDGLESFFKSFTIVSGRATLKVLYFSVLYLVVSIIVKLTDTFSFIDVWSSLTSVIILLLINCISVIQKKDIEKFKKLLKGDINNE